MDKIRIRGGHRLQGEIPIGGAKNAALPLMAAALLTDETLSLANLPHLADIATMSMLLAQLGVDIHLNGDSANDGHAARVMAFGIRDGRVHSLFIITNPEKLQHLDPLVPKDAFPGD